MGPGRDRTPTPGSAVRLASVARHVTDCATRPGDDFSNEYHSKNLAKQTTIIIKRIHIANVCLIESTVKTFDSVINYLTKLIFELSFLRISHNAGHRNTQKTQY